MSSYRYHHGDRPLPGYTVQRALGFGGFSEVYYALSDSGREVALKAVVRDEQIELRGIRQCMNLKSPHLVTIHDVKHNDAGDPFVVMEYVEGPSLRNLLDEAPSGLGTQKAAFFLREVAKALTYLHECGVVHRDLKPGNIFYENGYVKVGDYGLSKAMTPSRQGAQTITVGTLHYMAPEVGSGQYDRAIDIYALGAVCYEMITGQVPYLGQSPGEILMKHVSAEPELDGIDEPFATVVRKAMAKDPADRYGSVQEMVEAAFGAEHIRQSVSQFRPESLSVAAARVAGTAGAGSGGASAPAGTGEDTGPSGIPRDSTEAGGPQADRLDDRFEEAVDRAASRIGHAARRTAGRFLGGNGDGPPAETAEAAAPPAAPGLDSRNQADKWVLAGMAGAAVAAGAGILVGRMAAAILALALGGGAVAAVVLGVRHVLSGLWEKPLATQRLAIGGLAAAGAFAGAIATLGLDASRFLEGAVPGTLLAMVAVNWGRVLSIERANRTAFLQIILGAAIAAIAGALFGRGASYGWIVAAAAVGGAVLVVQWVVPFPKRGPNRAGGVRGGAAAAGKAEGNGSTAGAERGAVHSRSTGWEARPGEAGSPLLRLPAFVLGLIPFLGVPVAGLQRIYVGKIATGCLWLVTLGWLYIGQLVDLIMIASADFTDRSGRPLTRWVSEGPSVPDEHGAGANSPRKARRSRPAASSLPLTIVAGLFLAISSVVLLLFAVDGLDLLATASPWLKGTLDDFFGYEYWPRLVFRLGYFLAWSFGLVAVVVFVAARWRAGFPHVLRGVLGVGGVLVSISYLAEAMARLRWGEVVGEPLGPAIEALISMIEGIHGLGAALLFIASMVILVWRTGREPNRAEEP